MARCRMELSFLMVIILKSKTKIGTVSCFMKIKAISTNIAVRRNGKRQLMIETPESCDHRELIVPDE